MPRLTNAVPKYRHHRASGQAIVTLGGKDHYLGPWKSKASRVEYDRLISEWLATGRRAQPVGTALKITVVELCAAYWRFAKSYYRKNGQPTGAIPGIKVALRILKQHYGHTHAVDFGPVSLKALRETMIEAGQSRRYVNDNVDRIRRVFKWGASEELVSASVYEALKTVANLRRGRTKARELPPVKPVDDATIEMTLPALSPVVADMVRFQRLTGARPGEVCRIRPCDVERAGGVWAYRPSSHKTEHHDRHRLIYIGPKAQSVLLRYLDRPDNAFCFSPIESETLRREQRHAARRTPTKYGNRPGTNRKAKPNRTPRDHYTVDSYRRAVRRACERTLSEDQYWAPNQLRHAAATQIRAQFGLEAAQVALGHSHANVSEIYAERDLEKAKQVMRHIG